MILLMIETLYEKKYRGPIVIDFNAKPTYTQKVEFKDIKEKFYAVNHVFESQNKYGAIVRSEMILYFDDSSKVILHIP